MTLLKVLLLKFINLSDQLAGKLGFDRYSKDWVEKYVLCDPVTATWSVMSALRENYCLPMHLLQMVKINT